jgi:hypothetical protein
MTAGPTYFPIATSTLSSTVTSVLFNSIPQTYTDIILIMNVVPNGTGSGTFIINNDTNASYSYTAVAGLDTSGTVISFRGANQTAGNWLSSGAALTDQNSLYFNALNFQNYSNTTTYKNIILRENTGKSSYLGAYVNIWRSTSAITSITMQCSSSFGVGTTFTLYGLAVA